MVLSPTDSVKDRLAAWYHWEDPQCLEQALLVAAAQKVKVAEVRLVGFMETICVLAVQRASCP